MLLVRLGPKLYDAALMNRYRYQRETHEGNDTAESIKVHTELCHVSQSYQSAYHVILSAGQTQPMRC